MFSTKKALSILLPLNFFTKSKETYANCLNKLALFNTVTLDNITSLKQRTFRSYTKFVLELYNNIDFDNEENIHYDCIGCFLSFSSKQKLDAHYRLNKDCNIISTIDKLTPKPCPNPDCNTWWINDTELNKHINYHCHLTINAKKYFNFNNNNGFTNRRNPRETGLPNCALIIGNQNVQYDPILKRWNCLICNYSKNKYNWKQVLDHANSKHHNRPPNNITTHKPKGMHVELTNDITLQMETDYGGIRMQIEINNDIETRYLICLMCNYHNVTKCGIKVHLARKHNELLIRYDLKCPFCPKIYKDLGSINRHLYKKQQCPHIKENLNNIHWPDVWKQICSINNPNNNPPQPFYTNIDTTLNDPSSSSTSPP